MKKLKINRLFFIFLAVFFARMVEVSGEEVNLTPSVIKLSAGTFMVIPPSILEEYQQEAGKWGSPFNYLFLNYAATGPSTITEGEYTSYIPLVRLDRETLNPQGEPIMMDIVNLTESPKHQNTFTIDRSIYVVNFNKGGARGLVAVDSACVEGLSFDTGESHIIFDMNEGYVDCKL